MELKRFQIFKLVLEQTTISKVALSLGLAPSQVSRQITTLEKEVGGRLFYRTGRGMEPTPLALRLLPEVDAMLGHLEHLQELSRTAGEVLQGEVRIGLVPSLVPIVVVPLHQQMQRLHAGVLLNITEGSTSELDTWRAHGEIDISITFTYANRIPDGEILGAVPNHLVGPPSDRLTLQPSVSLDQLGSVTLIVPPLPNSTRQHLERVAAKRGLTLQIGMEANTIGVQAELTAAGCGYSIMPSYAAERAFAASRLPHSLIAEPEFVRKFRLDVSTARASTAAVRETARLVRQCMQQHFPPFAALEGLRKQQT